MTRTDRIIVARAAEQYRKCKAWMAARKPKKAGGLADAFPERTGMEVIEEYLVRSRGRVDESLAVQMASAAICQVEGEDTKKVSKMCARWAE